MTEATLADPTTPNYEAIKEKQQIAWSSGDYAQVGVTLQITGESLCEAMDIRAGQSVLDVAGGNGNVTLAAARRFCNVTSTDYVQHLLDSSAVRARAEGLSNIKFQLADAEALPFTDNSFDNVVSTFGVMFTPNQALAANEMSRVCRAGGKIGIANWTPDGFIGQLFKTLGGHITPPAGVQSPARWGTESFLQEHFPNAKEIDTRLQKFMFRYESAEHWMQIFSQYYGPLHKALQALDESSSKELRADILSLIERFNKATDGTAVIESDYLEAVITV